MQVFGKLLSSVSSSSAAADGSDEKTPPPAPEVVESSLEDVDLREHMVGILFSRSKLTHLQKQVRPVFPPVC